MSDLQLRVEFAGPQVSVQDCGRQGFMRFGVPASGPMDRRSAEISLAALNLPPTHPVIEVSRGGVRLACDLGSVVYAIAGGGFVVQSDGQTKGSWHIGRLSAGQKLSVRPGPWGSWTYLAFSADFELDQWLGSSATLGNGNFGAGVLSTGRVVKGSSRDSAILPMEIPCPIWARPRHSLRCILGPQDRFFDAQVIQSFLSSEFFLTDAGDRMGVRLKGPKILPKEALSIPSEPIVKGSVQVSGDGVATVLMADHQTTGGYPKIATILSCDLDGFAQCRPRDPIVFQAVSPDHAVTAARAERKRISDLVGRLRKRSASF